MRQIKAVFVFSEGTYVLAVDEDGAQMKEFQGPKSPELVDRMVEHLHPDVEWNEMPPPTSLKAKISNRMFIEFDGREDRASRGLIGRWFPDHHPRLIDNMLAQLVREEHIKVEEKMGISFFYVPSTWQKSA